MQSKADFDPSRIMRVSIDDVYANDYNPKKKNTPEYKKVVRSLQLNGLKQPIMVREVEGQYVIVDGEQRYTAAKELGYTELYIYNLGDIPEAEAKALTLWMEVQVPFDDIQLEPIVMELNKLNIEVPQVDIEIAEPDGTSKEYDYDDYESGKLVRVYGAPPYSVLDTRQAYWQDGRKKWLELGIKSELGRKDTLLALGALNNKRGRDMPSLSVFDPFLCELMYRWFNVEEGTVLDPFAGGSVRGVVAGKLGLKYTGIELRGEQVEENRRQADDIFSNDPVKPQWVIGDSDVVLDSGSIGNEYDMIFSCPPYADLEVYSDDPADLSNMEYSDFLRGYRSIIKKSCDKLRDGGFAVFVVSEVRGKKSEYYNFVSDTINAFIDAEDMHYYNELILLNTVGTAGIRAGHIFDASRKVARIHQNILVFYKGNPKNVADKWRGIKVLDNNGNPIEEL